MQNMQGDTMTHRELGQLGEQVVVTAQNPEDASIQGTGRKRDIQGETKGPTRMLGGKPGESGGKSEGKQDPRCRNSR